ncbi:MAG: hypothetical protein WBO06_01320 [Gammaproteobacteria bacterium]
MDDQRTRLCDRRQNNYKPRYPFKDSKGATIRECRRKIQDRRIGNIEAELTSGVVIG